MVETIFRPVPTYTDLYVGTDGSIVLAGHGELEQKDYGAPYLRVLIKGVNGGALVHRLVTSAFLGPCPAGMEVRHGQGGSKDNSLGNLCYGTSSDNRQDMVRHGNSWQANKSYCPSGHEYTAENTYRRPRSANRECRTCRAISSKAQSEKAVRQRRSCAAMKGDG